MRWLLLIMAFFLPGLLAPGVAAAADRPHAELPSAGQPARRVPTTGYTLSMIWTPEHCFADARHGGGTGDPQCSGSARTGFTLHGLWPDGDGPNRWPQFCHPVAILTDGQIATGIGATPSAQLLQHEWAKHGSCMTDDPVQYFQLEDGLYAGIHAPDMASLAHRRGLTVGQFQSAFAAANPGMRADMMRLNVNKNGWLEEVWLCLGLDKRPRTCPAGQGGAQPGDLVKVQAP
ncbi:ribonuclease T2 family protein [Sphingomonas abietis]|uniref:Ribonuclease T n=1 Tax=Sphingomonas abietis TaxID=3012344 RepID=A0ABY7NLF1_9SPHN|nr:ribonuclease T [Sphingomonas abietis]WBO21630.1 ribonuclease T [Sphingomonas abietis]